MKGHSAAGFSMPGHTSSSESSDTGTDSSNESKSSKMKKKKSKSKRRRKLLRLNQYTSSHKKPKSFDDCVAASMGLACKLLEKGFDISGYLQHVWFLAEQSALNRFRPECILLYDQGVRDKAAANGLTTFGYGDADNFYRYLGSAALKKESKMKSVPSSRYPENKGKTDIPELKICGLYNHGHCNYGTACFRKHICFACQQPHPRSECPNVVSGGKSFHSTHH